MKKLKTFLYLMVFVSLIISNLRAEIIDLGNLAGVNSINNNGEIVGAIHFQSAVLILYDPISGVTMINLDPIGIYSRATGINNFRQIVGYGQQSRPGIIKPLLFDPTGNGDNIILGEFEGAAAAINNNGQIVGYSNNSVAAWLFDITGNGNNVYLGEGGAGSISDTGLIVGSNLPYSPDGWQATLFDPTGGGNNIYLGKLFPGDDRSFARDVNDSGQIIGYSGGPEEGYTATLFDITGGGNNIALGAIGESEARAINNHGQVVGEENGHAVLFDISGGGNNVDLNDLIDPSLGWELRDASDINDNGWIVGRGYKGGEPRCFLLIPIEIVNVNIDIKPDAEDNCVNINDHGVIPIAILGSADFDVTQVDPATCECSGMTVKMAGKSNKSLASYEDSNGDGFDDLVVKIEDSDSVLDPGAGTATLTCELYDGTPIEGTDDICMVP